MTPVTSSEFSGSPEKFTLIAVDVVELSPLTSQHASDFLAARLVYKCIAYKAFVASRGV